MLNYTKLMKEFEQIPTVLQSYTNALSQIGPLWQVLCPHDNLYDLLQQQSQYTITQWQGRVDTTIDVPVNIHHNYSVIGVDGSQIYADRHQGISCFLINIGTVSLQYGQTSSVQFASQPYLIAQSSDQEHVADEFVNCTRTQYELQELLNVGQKALPSTLLLCDGSLIFWHLTGKELLQKQFLSKYLCIYEELYKKRIIHASLISLPKSKDLVQCLKAALLIPEFDAYQQISVETIGQLFDTNLVNFFLKPNTRTTLFASNSSMVDHYPAPLKIFFWYQHVGDEIVRVEVPAWIAQDPLLIQEIAYIIADQCKKGQGYPVCLAEAHEQAVVKSADRDLFYKMLERSIGVEAYMQSIKSLKKKYRAV